MNKKIDNKGFSLVELIIVITIMAILVGVLVPQFFKYVERSRQSADMQTVQELKTAIEVYATGSEGITEDATIKISSTGVTVGGSGEAACTDAGLEKTAKLKSSGWTTAATYKFSHTTLTWESPASCPNTKEPKSNMQSVFGTSGTTTTTTTGGGG